MPSMVAHGQTTRPRRARPWACAFLASIAPALACKNADLTPGTPDDGGASSSASGSAGGSSSSSGSSSSGSSSSGSAQGSSSGTSAGSSSSGSALPEGGFSDDAGAPWFDSGVERGCASNANPTDPTAGWTEYADTFPPPSGAADPHLEYPYTLGDQIHCMTTLPIGDQSSPCRFSLVNGVETYWIFQTDPPHLAPSSGAAPTDPRTEMHYSTFTAQDPHPARMWTGDVMVAGAADGTPPAHNTIIQVHTDATGQGPVYLRVENGSLFQLGGPTYYAPTVGKWSNLKVAFDVTTLHSTVWVNDCQVGTWDGSSFVSGNLPGGTVFYFKNGSYGCTTGECIDKFANIRFYWK